MTMNFELVVKQEHHTLCEVFFSHLSALICVQYCFNN